MPGNGVLNPPVINGGSAGAYDLTGKQTSGDPDLWINGQDLNPSGYSTWKYQMSGDAARNAYNSLEAERARTYNSAEAAKQREWEEYMSNSAYQRAAADMKAAGINPALAFGGGANAASTPSGSAASASAAHSASTGQSSILGNIARIAAIVISKGLAAKFTHSASIAAKAGQSVIGSVAKAAADEGKASSAFKVTPEMIRIAQARWF